MIQISIDPSIILKTETTGISYEIAVAISGVSTVPGDEVLSGKSNDNIKDLLYPWRWNDGDKITKFRLYWIQGETIDPNRPTIDFSVKEFDTVLSGMNAPVDYAADKADLIKHYEDVLETKIFEQGNLLSNQVAWPFKENTSSQEISLTDVAPDQADGGQSQKETGIYTSFIGTAAQRLAPLNQTLNLVYFASTGNIIFEGELPTAFVIFPINGGRWEGQYPIGPHPADPGNDSNLFRVHYSTNDTTVFCQVTPLPARSSVATDVGLRDDIGNFLGKVKLHVNDRTDWVPQLIEMAAAEFNLPRLFWDYIDSFKGMFYCADGNHAVGYRKLLDNVSDFLWASLRDTMGFGPDLSHTADGLLEVIVARYLKDINQQDDDNYAEKAGLMLEKMGEKDAVRELDKKYNNLEAWKNTISNVVENEIFEYDAEFKTLIQNLSFKMPSPMEGDTIPDPQAVNMAIEDWFSAWEHFFQLLDKNPDLRYPLLYVQYMTDVVKDMLSFDALPGIEQGLETAEKQKWNWFKNLLSETVNIYQMQQVGVASRYQAIIVPNEESASGDDLVPKVVSNCISALQKYAKDRITPGIFYPPVEDPFRETPENFPPGPTWDGFVNVSGISLEHMDQSIKDIIRQTSPTPPNLQIRVGDLSKESDDLADEIAGNIVVMRRSDALNSNSFSSGWRYLNWAKVFALKNDTEPGNMFQNSYLVPASLPEMPGIKMPYLEVSNEKLSFIAGHDTFVDTNFERGDVEPQLQYLFDEKARNAFALWYGYNYQFAGFVALNSGVLPKGLRKEEKIWNVPAVEPNLNDYNSNNDDSIARYAHLRRVPVSSARVQTATLDDNEKPTKAPTLPNGFLPLAFELPEWKGNQLEKLDDKIAEEIHATSVSKAQSHFLLANGEHFKQQQLKLTFRKPTTSFWDWYAWMGLDANEIVNGDGNTKTAAQYALERDLENRINQTQGKDALAVEQGNKLCDPAVGDTLIVFIDKLFPAYKPDFAVAPVTLAYDQQNDSAVEKAIRDPFRNVVVKEGATTSVEKDTTGSLKSITVANGEVIRIRVCAAIDQRHFEGQSKRFHSWMKEQYTPYNDVYLTEPVEMWFETAKDDSWSDVLPADRVAILKSRAKMLWENTQVNDQEWVDNVWVRRKDKVFTHIEKTQETSTWLPYFSRLEVKHQVWNWNGRLDESKKLSSQTDKLDPDSNSDSPATSDAMKWEAWAFSDRPDFSSLIYQTNILASRLTETDKAISQQVFCDHRPGDEKALYYRVSVTAHSRYELLGKEYIGTIDAGIDVETVKNNWRRYLRACCRSTKLTKPSVRFMVPLTKSIKECGDKDEVAAASILVVLNDRWFTEAGLAEQAEIGIEVVKAPDPDKRRYLNAGNDPILTSAGLAEIGTSGESETPVIELVDDRDTASARQSLKMSDDMAVFTPKGPVGFTFDIGAQTPRLRGCGFVVNLPDINPFLQPGYHGLAGNLKAWSFMCIAVRRVLRPQLFAGTDPDSYTSEWSAKEWVQFLPAVDSFIPTSWKSQVKKAGAIELKGNGINNLFLPDGTVLPVFDGTFEARMKRYIIVTETVSDIGGQPVERYVGTYSVAKNADQYKLVVNHPEGGSENRKIVDGYIRILLVRTNLEPIDDDKPVWDRLFGENAKSGPDFDRVQDDPTAAMPLVSERVPFKLSNLE